MPNESFQITMQGYASEYLTSASIMHKIFEMKNIIKSLKYNHITIGF